MKLAELEAKQRADISEAWAKAIKEQQEAEQRKYAGLQFLCGYVAEMIQESDSVDADDVLQFLTVSPSGGNGGFLTVHGDPFTYAIPCWWNATLNIPEHKTIYRGGRTLEDSKSEFRAVWDNGGWFVHDEGTPALPLAQALIAAADAHKAAREAEELPF